ncbi:hypothetical protein KM043_013218 [Ampulex compressa]|nr:hypothetical protein KM043_013218 [Ampulex compressa]
MESGRACVTVDTVHRFARDVAARKSFRITAEVIQSLGILRRTSEESRIAATPSTDDGTSLGCGYYVLRIPEKSTDTIGAKTSLSMSIQIPT